jgi:DNA-binding beta-propeller fold protein YncE
MSLLAITLLATSCSSTRPTTSFTATGAATYTVATLTGSDGTGISTKGVRMPSGWTLRPFGTQVTTEAQPDGVAVSPDGSTVYAPTSGQWNESLTVLDTKSLAVHSVPDGSAFLGTVAAPGGAIYVAAGGRNQILQYTADGANGAVGPSDFKALIPPLASSAGMGFAAPGYPGNMVLGPDNWLYAAGTLPMKASEITAADPQTGTNPCPGNSDTGFKATSAGTLRPPQSPVTMPTSCSVVDAIQIAPGGAKTGPTPPTHLIAVGQDAYGIAIAPTSSTLYVSNWADGSNKSRGAGNGTVSVVRLAADGTGREIQTIPVGLQPMGIALSPDGHTLAVADAMSDEISLLSLAPDGSVTSSSTEKVGLAADGGPGGSEPVAVTYAPDGRLLVSLFGYNAIEVMASNGQPISQTIGVSTGGSSSKVTVPFTLIPTGWMPWAMGVGPEPAGTPSPGVSRLYVANYQGNGASSGLYDPASDTVGANGTEGSLSVIDLPPVGTGTGNASLSTSTAQAIAADDFLPYVDAAYRDPATDPCMAAALPDGTSTFSPLICAASRGRVDRKSLHVVVVLRENKTVDSMLGYLHSTLPALDARQQFETYGPGQSSNLAQLATHYGIDDNSYVAGDESATGHTTLASGETTPQTELFVHVDNDAGYRGSRKNDPLSSVDNTTTRLSDEALAAGASELTYGGDLNNNSPSSVNDVPAAIWGNASSPAFTGQNTDFPDTNRAEILTTGVTTSMAWDSLVSATPPSMFGKPIGLCGSSAGFCDYPHSTPNDYSKYSVAGWTASYRQCISRGGTDDHCQSTMPNLTVAEMPDNHTDVFNNGNNPMMWAPQVMVANNDQATGELVAGLSQSPFWSHTLVMVIEDDTQFTADHVNALRSYVVTAGGLAAPLGTTGKVSHQVSSFCGVDRTIEDLLSLPSMEACDATAAPLDSLVAATIPTGTLKRYSPVTPNTPIFLPFPSARSVQLTLWCAGNKPTGIGFEGLLHYQNQECAASSVGALEVSHNNGT